MPNLEIQKYTLFPTEIFISKIEDLNTNKFIEVLKKEQKINPEGVNKSNIGGWQSRDNIHDLEDLSPLCDAVNDICRQLFQKTSTITGMWGNISQKYHYNNIHNHGYPSAQPFEDEFSGVFYLKVNPNSGVLNFWEFSITPHGIPFPPETNHLILFPSYVKHSVETNISDEERISIAFNVKLT